MNAGAINFLIKRFDEQPVLESDLPQTAAGVFQADDGHGGIAGDFARGVRAHACTTCMPPGCFWRLSTDVRFAPQAADQKRPLGREQRSSFDAIRLAIERRGGRDGGGLSCPRRRRRPGTAAEVRRPRLCKGKRFNSEIISSMIESLIYGSSRRATRLDHVSDRQHLQGEHV